MTNIYPPRPTATREMIMNAAELVAKQLDTFSPEDISKAYSHPMDGYEVAKELDSRFRYSCCLEDAEILDNMAFLVRKQVREAQKEWARTHDIQPPPPIGTRITHGVIAKICDHEPATYLVKENGCQVDGRYMLIKFEYAIEETNQ